ncbi:hypothetical protein ACFP2T_47790 [Plantactinospora solaniradicis]|uniref:Uncharacterized protein n=1 Tax=Plantactinospora solaniradicis TaxID=1723736 RepID=A0ABW1KUV5_9ACTN
MSANLYAADLTGADLRHRTDGPLGAGPNAARHRFPVPDALRLVRAGVATT